MNDLNWSDYDFTKIPFDDIIQFGQRTLLYRDIFTVSWLLGRYCNYKCSYCWPYARSDTKDFRPTSLCLSTIDEIKRQARGNGFNSFHFSLSGGEPSFHPGYFDILDHLAQDINNTNYTSLHMTSNCSQPIEWFEKYIENTKIFHRVSITASFHSEYINTTYKKEQFIKKLILCQEHDIQITINMVMRPDHFFNDYNIARLFHIKGINVTLKPQSDPTASKVVDGYTKEMLDILYNGMPQRAYTENKRIWADRPKPTFEVPAYNNDVPESAIPHHMQIEFEDSTGKRWYMDQAERFNSFNFNKFKGWLCNSGYQGIVIREPDGSVKRSYSCHDAPLGNIETGFTLFKTPTICTTESCVSSADSKIPKKRQQ